MLKHMGCMWRLESKCFVAYGGSDQVNVQSSTHNFCKWISHPKTQYATMISFSFTLKTPVTLNGNYHHGYIPPPFLSLDLSISDFIQFKAPLKAKHHWFLFVCLLSRCVAVQAVGVCVKTGGQRDADTQAWMHGSVEKARTPTHTHTTNTYNFWAQQQQTGLQFRWGPMGLPGLAVQCFWRIKL